MKIAQSFLSMIKSYKILSILIGLTVLSSIILPVVLLRPVYDEVILIESEDDFKKASRITKEIQDLDNEMSNLKEDITNLKNELLCD